MSVVFATRADLEPIKKKASETEQQLGTVKLNVDQQGQDIAAAHQRVDDLEQYNRAQDGDISTLRTDVDANTTRLNGVDLQLLGFQQDIVSLVQRQDSTDQKLGDVDAALDELHNYAQALINGGA